MQEPQSLCCLPVVPQEQWYSHAPFSIGAAWSHLITYVDHQFRVSPQGTFSLYCLKMFSFLCCPPKSPSLPLLFRCHSQPGPSFSLNHTHMILKIENILEIMSNSTLKNSLSNSGVPDHTLYPNYPIVKIPIHQRSS